MSWKPFFVRDSRDWIVIGGVGLVSLAAWIGFSDVSIRTGIAAGLLVWGLFFIYTGR